LVPNPGQEDLNTNGVGDVCEDSAPVFTTTQDTTAPEDQTYTYVVTATDSDNDVVDLSIGGLPSWASFTVDTSAAGTATATLTGAPANGDVGSYPVTITASSTTLTTDQSFTIVVSNANDDPVFTSTAVTAATQDVTYTYTVTVSDVDPAPDTLTLSEVTIPTWLTFTTATGVLTGTPTSAHVGDHPVVIRVNDGTVDVDQSFTITVALPGTPIPMLTLMDSSNGGVVGFEMDGSTGFEYWTDTFNAGTGVFSFNDYEYNYGTGAFGISSDDSDLLLSGTSWVAEDHIVASDDGNGGLNLSIRSPSDAEVASFNLTAKFVNIEGETIINYLNDAEWQAAMVDQAAVFPAGAKLISEYRFEALSDSYWLWNDDWCIGNGTQYSDLNNNCNGVYVGTTTTISGYAETLAQVIEASAWVDNDDGSTPSGVISWVASDDVYGSYLQVQLIANGDANYYVIDNNVGVSDVDRATLVDTGSWTLDSSSGVEMIHYEVPAESATMFADDLDEGITFFMTVQNGFVRQGESDVQGDVSFDNNMLNGVAKDAILANFDAIQALGYHNVDLTAGPGYSLYWDAGLGSWCLDQISFDGTNFTLVDYDNYGATACDGVSAPGTSSGTYSVDSAGVLMLNDAVDIWYQQVTGVSTTYGAKTSCASATSTVPSSCTRDTGLSYEFDDPNTATQAKDALNSLANLDCNFETPWNNGAPDPLSSFDDFSVVVSDCGGIQTLTSTDVEGAWVENYWSGSAEETEVWVFNANGTADFTAYSDGVVNDSGTVGWTLSNNLITLTDGSSFMDIWAMTPQGLRAYSEEPSWGSDLSVATTSTQDGQIWTSDYNKAGTCGFESGWIDTDPGQPIVPVSFADFEASVADCDTGFQPIPTVAAQVSGLSLNEQPEVTTFNVLNGTSELGTQGNPGTGAYYANDGSGFQLSFQWWVETINSVDYVVIYTNESIDPSITTSIGSGFWLRETSVLMNVVDNDSSGTPTAGDSMEFYKYAEQSNYSDTVRTTGTDGEAWISTNNIIQ